MVEIDTRTCLSLSPPLTQRGAPTGSRPDSLLASPEPCLLDHGPMVTSSSRSLTTHAQNRPRVGEQEPPVRQECSPVQISSVQPPRHKMPFLADRFMEPFNGPPMTGVLARPVRKASTPDPGADRHHTPAPPFVTSRRTHRRLDATARAEPRPDDRRRSSRRLEHHHGTALGFRTLGLPHALPPHHPQPPRSRQPQTSPRSLL